MFKCDNCDLRFTKKSNMKRHRKKHSDEPSIKCHYCEKRFSRDEVLNRHVKTCSLNPENRRDEVISEPPAKKAKQRCEVCDLYIFNYHTHLRSATHKENQLKNCEDDECVQIINTAYKSRIMSFRVHSLKTMLTAKEFMRDVESRVKKLIKSKRELLGSGVKVNFELFALYTKYEDGVDDPDNGAEEKSFNTKNKEIALDEDLDDIYDEFLDEICTKADDFQEKGSGWALIRTLHLEVNVNKFSPLKGTSFFALPKWIRDKKACINVRNDDESCFFWAVVSALYPVDNNSHRVSSYPHYGSVLNVKGIECPVTHSNIKKFEKLNNISINVYGVEKEQIFNILYYTSGKCEKHVNLLYIENGEKAHYCWIKNLSRLIRSQLTKHCEKVWFCDGCLLPFHNEVKYVEHTKQDCSHVKTTLPMCDNNILKFKNVNNQLRAPVIVYADFEALLTPIQTCFPSPSSSYTLNYQQHEPYSFGYFIKCDYDDSLSKYVSYRGEDCAKSFLKSLETELAPFIKSMNTVTAMNPLTSEQVIDFERVAKCHICCKELNNDKVRDHCHLTGEYRGAAHFACNLNYKSKNTIPIVFHNLSQYDSHFIVRVLRDNDIDVIPKNKENFIGFIIKHFGGMNVNLRFIDSYRFLASSLASLAGNLPEYCFVNVNKHLPENTYLLRRKGVFPYEYIVSMEKLEEVSLPPQQAFYSSLNKCDISDEDYSHAQKVWATFGCQTIGEYSDLYLKTDVLLLADIFENFRDVCLKTYNLDPAHYFTAPGLSWDAMLKYTEVELELLTDISMIRFVSKGIRGGLSQCCGNYALANNKYLDDYDPEKASTYIIYLDANNQYGWAMSQYLPVKDFRWLLPDEVENFKLNRVQTDSGRGYLLEVDLAYTESLHNLHNDLPFCVENKVPEVESSKTPKLIASLHDKQNYIIHYVNLKQALEHGIVLKKIHRILEFTQSAWLRPYIELNTAMRTKAENSFEKDFYKLMNNAVFGKTMENVDKRVDVRLVNRWENKLKRQGARNLIARLNFHSCTIISEDITIIQMNKNNVYYNKPIYVGFTVLELSKTLMYDFHYNYILPKFGLNVRLLYTDTDSFIYEVTTDDFYQDIKPDLNERFDTSEFPPNNIYGLPQVNKKVVGMFKDECPESLIVEFIGLRSKVYSISKQNGACLKKIKGIQKSVISNDITNEDFMKCLNDCIIKHSDTRIIRSKAHTVYSQSINKVALKNCDDKRFHIPNHRTLAWGHKDINLYRKNI